MRFGYNRVAEGKDLSIGVLIPKVMLREFEEVFLDSYSIKTWKRVIKSNSC